MITIIICAMLLFFLIATLDEDIGSGFVGLIFGAGMGFIIAMVIGGFYPEKKITVKQPLENITDNSTIHGNLFLGFGSVNGSPTYSWYEQTAENTFERKDVDASDAKVHYVADGVRPYYTKVVHDEPSGLKTWGIGLGGDYTDAYNFYVPRGSITHEYNLDAQG